MGRSPAASSRRAFLHRCALGLAGLVAWPATARAARIGLIRNGPHPTPRPGITAAKVLAADQLADHKDLVELFDQVREIPQIVDGIRCQCGCAELEGYYSLLSCYEGTAMAKHCQVCQGQARLAHRLHKDGKSLDQIREAIDARFG